MNREAKKTADTTKRTTATVRLRAPEGITLVLIKKKRRDYRNQNIPSTAMLIGFLFEMDLLSSP